MFSFRVLFRSIPPVTARHFAKHRPNVRLFATATIELEPQIIYPNGNRKLGMYLDQLSEQTNESNLKQIHWKYALRKSIVQQIVELNNEMKDETDAEILNLAQDEKQVNEMNLFLISIHSCNNLFASFCRISSSDWHILTQNWSTKFLCWTPTRAITHWSSRFGTVWEAKRPHYSPANCSICI